MSIWLFAGLECSVNGYCRTIGFRVWGIIRVYGLGLRAGSFKQHRFCCSRCEEGQFEVNVAASPPPVFWLDRPRRGKLQNDG